MRTSPKLLLPAALIALCVLCLTTTAAQEEKKTFVPAKASLNGIVVFRAGGKDAASYRFGGDLAKPVLWPLLSPNNKEVTRAWPMRPAGKGGSTDHKHQISAWFTYGDVIPEGVEIKHKRKGVEGVDFWAEEPGCGRTVVLDTGPRDPQLAWLGFAKSTSSTPLHRIAAPHSTAPPHDYNERDKNGHTIGSEIEWRTANGEKLMNELRLIRFFNYTTARLIVVDINLAASVVPITFGDTKEGACGVRVADSMTEKAGKGRITNAEGKVGEKQCWGRISAWCDYSGPVEGETVGIAIFASPDNPVPSCWHSRAYGLMAANPFGRAKSGFPDMKDKKDKTDLVYLKKGDFLHLRYGIFVHTGDVKEGKVAEAYELFKKIK